MKKRKSWTQYANTILIFADAVSEAWARAVRDGAVTDDEIVAELYRLADEHKKTKSKRR